MELTRQGISLTYFIAGLFILDIKRGEKVATKIYETKITTSYGDMLDMYWQLYGFDILPTDEIILTIKEDEDDKNALIRKVYKLEETEYGLMRITISSSEMEKLDKGKYKYDLVRVRNVDGEPQRITLIYPSDFIVVGVVHDE